MRWAILAGIAAAGAVGALARYALDGVISDRAGGPFPWGTFAINVSGSLLLGFLFVMLTERWTTPPWVRPTVTMGLLGAYTTFSTFTLETVRLVQDGAWLFAAANVAASLAAGLVAVWIGIVVARAI